MSGVFPLVEMKRSRESRFNRFIVCTVTELASAVLLGQLVAYDNELLVISGALVEASVSVSDGRQAGAVAVCLG